MSKRRKAREITLQGLYIYEIANENVEEITKFSWVEDNFPPEIYFFSQALITGTIENIKEIDRLIEEYILKKHLDRLSIVDRNILRFSIYSLVFQKDIHPVVVINEAIDLAKKYGEQNSFKLINGALDNIQKHVSKINS